MHLLDLATVLATTDDHPVRRSRLLYLVDGDAGMEPAGFADAVGDVAAVLDRLDAEGADGLAVQAPVHAADEPTPRRGAVVASRRGGFAVAVAGVDGQPDLSSDTAPRPDDPAPLQACWRLVVHVLAALDRTDAIPEPPDDPHPAAYLAAVWLGGVLGDADGRDAVLDDLDALPDEPALVAGLGLRADLAGWDAVHAVAARHAPDAATRLGRNGVAWQAHVLLADPGEVLATLAATGRADLADTLFDDLIARGWARMVGPA